MEKVDSELCLYCFISILINGRCRGKFKGEKGLRQGDPLSPFLFNLIVDVVGRLIDKATTRNIIRGLHASREQVEMSHI